MNGREMEDQKDYVRIDEEVDQSSPLMSTEHTDLTGKAYRGFTRMIADQKIANNRWKLTTDEH